MDDSTTRCPCGENKDFDGFMIQCEICQVWQHGECVGVNEANVPDRYFCKQCIPTHPIHQQGNVLLIQRAREARRHKAAFRKRDSQRSRRPRDSDRSRNKKRKRKPNSRRGKKAAQAADSSGEEESGKSSKRSRSRAQLAEQKRERKELLRLLDSFNGSSSSRTPRRNGPDNGKASARRRPTAQEQQRLRRKEEERRKRKFEERRKLQNKLRSRLMVDRGSGRPVELSPMYLGRKAWLLQAYQSDHRYNQHSSLLSHGSKLPFGKRVLVNYMTEQWSARNPLRAGCEATPGPETRPLSSTSAGGYAPPAVVVPANGFPSLPATLANTAVEERSIPMEMDLSPVEESTPMEKRCDDALSKYQFPRIESEEASPQSAGKARAQGAHQSRNGNHNPNGGGAPRFVMEQPVKEMVLSREEGRGQPEAGERPELAPAPAFGRAAQERTGGSSRTAPMALDRQPLANGVSHNGVEPANGHMKLGNGTHLNGKLSAIESR